MSTPFCFSVPRRYPCWLASGASVDRGAGMLCWLEANAIDRLWALACPIISLSPGLELHISKDMRRPRQNVSHMSPANWSCSKHCRHLHFTDLVENLHKLKWVRYSVLKEKYLHCNALLLLYFWDNLSFTFVVSIISVINEVLNKRLSCLLGKMFEMNDFFKNTSILVCFNEKS